MKKNYLIDQLIRYARVHLQDEVEAAYLNRSEKMSAPIDLETINASYDGHFNKEVGPTFSTLLFSYIDKRNINEVLLYKSIGISKAHFSKIRSQINYQPTKDTVFKFLIGLNLSLKDSFLLLESSGFTFQSSQLRDLIIKGAIELSIFDVFSIDHALSEAHLLPLFYK
jgi:hypothetical protein